MKKVFSFLRSMRFGLLLLILIALFSVLGSVIPQDRDYVWYVQNYGNFHWLILALQLNRVFQSWYFLLLLVLLCLNLTLCSLLRIVPLVRGGRSFVSSAAGMKNSLSLTGEGVRRLEKYLETAGCRRTDFGSCRVYARNRIGRYGSFLTHLAILLTVIFGAAALALPQVNDLDCMPGEVLSLADGTEIRVESFTAKNDEGRLDYESILSVALPDGRQSGPRSVRVNFPLRFGPYKIYQQSYGTAGSVTVTNQSNGGQDTFLISDPSFLSLDNLNGLWVLALYPDYLVNESGEILPIPASAGVDYARPVYYAQISDNGENTAGLFFPGDTVEVGGLSFRFNDPAQYPGLRIKHTPALISALLIASFGLMILGLAVLFFLPPVLVKVDDEGCAVGGPKPEGTMLALKALLKDCRKEVSE